MRSIGLACVLFGMWQAGCLPTDTRCEDIARCNYWIEYPDASDGGLPEVSDAIADARAPDRSVITDSPATVLPDVDAAALPSDDAATSSDALDGDQERGQCDAAKAPGDMPCLIDEAYGVFVAPSAAGGDSGRLPSADGTRAHPFPTIAEALPRAKAVGKHVYVCDSGSGFAGAITVDETLDGLRVFGGFECSGWTYDATRRAKLIAGTSPVLKVANLAAGILLENLEILAGDAANPGESSIGIVVDASAGVKLRRVKVTAGRGKGGTNGENGGGPSNAPALTGVQGNPGVNACAADPRGGIAVTGACNGLDPSTGASGGNGAPNAASKGGPGDDGSPPYAAGKGGLGQPVSGAWDCGLGRGQDGSNGRDGSPGSDGSGLGSLTTEGWKGIAGVDGTSGQPGQGGGGGGGAKAPLACLASDGGALSPTGASGGSGGAGGCGGRAGKGGMAGGASIALVSIRSEVTLESCEFTAGDGGNGGNGGDGQRGGNGGMPGPGGEGAGSSRNACDGGKGGQGGKGGVGGGGAGGHSIGVAFQGKAPAGLDITAVKVGAKGTGGQQGGGTLKAGDGLAQPLQEFPIPDAGT